MTVFFCMQVSGIKRRGVTNSDFVKNEFYRNWFKEKMSATMPRTESVFEEFSDAKRKIQEVFEQIKEQIEAVQEIAHIFKLQKSF